MGHTFLAALLAAGRAIHSIEDLIKMREINSVQRKKAFERAQRESKWIRNIANISTGGHDDHNTVKWDWDYGDTEWGLWISCTSQESYGHVYHWLPHEARWKHRLHAVPLSLKVADGISYLVNLAATQASYHELLAGARSAYAPLINSAAQLVPLVKQNSTRVILSAVKGLRHLKEEQQCPMWAAVRDILVHESNFLGEIEFLTLADEYPYRQRRCEGF